MKTKINLLRQQLQFAAQYLTTVMVLLLLNGISAAPALTIEQIAQKALTATVYLEMKDNTGETLGFGSGFFVNENLIATNYHVIQGAATGTAKLVENTRNMPKFNPELNKAYINYINEYETYTIEGSTATDETNDLVLLEVSTRVKDPEFLEIYRKLLPIQPLSLGNSDDVKIGAPVYVAGNPKGLEGTFSSGIISSRRGRHTEERLQMTAPVSPGSSGGPVLNNKGEVIGIAFMTIEGGQNLNFAIPSNYLKTLLVQSGTVKPLLEDKQFISARTYFLRGDAMYAMELYEEAIVAYDQAIHLKLNYIEAYNNRGIAKSAIGQYFAAIADFDKAVEIKPDFAKAYLFRGAVKEDLGQNATAIADYDKAIQIAPDDAIVYYFRGMAKETLKQHFAAISDFDKAIQLAPDFAEVYHSRGKSKGLLGQHFAAISDFDKAIQLEPDYAEVYHSRGKSKGFLGQIFAAISDFDKAIQLKPDDAEVYCDRGSAKLLLGQHLAAISDFNKAIQLKPDYAKAYVSRGISKHKLGDTWEAKQDLQTASKIAERAGDTDTKDLAEFTLRFLERSGR